MAVVNLVGSRVLTPNAQTPAVLGAPGTGGGAVRSWTETVETNADDSTGTTYHLASLPSNARILGASTISWDDLGTTPGTLDIGVFNQSGKSDITDSVAALSNGHAIIAAGSAAIVGDIANYGIQLWDHATGTTDPVATLDVKATLVDFDINAAGTITVEILYTLD